MKKLIWLSIFSFSTVAFGFANPLLKEGDRLWNLRHQPRQAYEAMYVYRKAVAKKPQYEELLKYARILMFVGRFLEKDEDKKENLFNLCLQYSNRAQKLNQKGLEPFLLRGICHAELAGVDNSLSQAKKAKKNLEVIIRTNPDFYNGMAHTILGKLYNELPGWPLSYGDDDKAIEILRQALKLNPKNRYNYLFLAEVLWEEGEEKEAREKLKMGLKLPLNPKIITEDKNCIKELYNLKKKIED